MLHQVSPHLPFLLAVNCSSESSAEPVVKLSSLARSLQDGAQSRPYPLVTYAHEQSSKQARMSSKQYFVFIHTLFRALCIVVFGITFIHSESITADRDRYAASKVNTQAAIDEINEVLRYLFPMVPHKSHIILTSRNQKLWIEHPNVVKTSEEFVADSLQNEKNDKISEYAEEEEEEETMGRFIGKHRIPPVALLPGLATELGPEARELARVPPASQRVITVLDTVSGSRGPPSFSGAKEMLPKVHSTGSRKAVGEQRLPHFLVHGGNGKPRAHARPEPARVPVKPESTTPSLGKRGPECMRRCILQGLLHPVQCHSLC